MNKHPLEIARERWAELAAQGEQSPERGTQIAARLMRQIIPLFNDLMVAESQNASIADLDDAMHSLIGTMVGQYLCNSLASMKGSAFPAELLIQQYLNEQNACIRAAIEYMQQQGFIARMPDPAKLS